MNLPSIAALATKYGITAKKYLGQNFIFDSNLCDKIVAASDIGPASYVLEIGPGTAGLTRAILAKGIRKLTLIETDKNFAPLLEEINNLHPNLIIHFTDALKVPLASLGAEQKLDIVANLPYNISNRLLLKWFEQLDMIQSMSLMFQKEVAERLVAKPGQKSYGRLSVIAQINCQVKKCFDVSPKSFIPPPKVWSSIVSLIPRSDRPGAKLAQKLQLITRLAFSKRRKMLKSSLKLLDNKIIEKLEYINIDPSLRAENLTPQDYLTIAQISWQNMNSDGELIVCK